MLYLSQEQYELYKIYMIKKSFSSKSQTIGQSINCKRKIYKLKKFFSQKSQTIGQSSRIYFVFLIVAALSVNRPYYAVGEPRRTDSL